MRRVRESTPTSQPCIVGARERDSSRTAAAFFAEHPFERRPPRLEKLSARRFFALLDGDAPRSSGATQRRE